MKEALNIDAWARREHFLFFRQFDEPLFGICSHVDCTKAYQYCKKQGVSLFVYYLHKTLEAVNHIVAFRYRMEGEKIYLYDKVDASTTINRPDGTFGFSHITYEQDFELFTRNAKEEIQRVQNDKALFPATSAENVIHFSALPWIDFSSISHARHFGFADSCPKISVGKMTTHGNAQRMPVSVHVHHALMDGKNVAEFFDLFQTFMNEH